MVNTANIHTNTAHRFSAENELVEFVPVDDGDNFEIYHNESLVATVPAPHTTFIPTFVTWRELFTNYVPFIPTYVEIGSLGVVYTIEAINGVYKFEGSAPALAWYLNTYEQALEYAMLQLHDDADVLAEGCHG